MNHLYGESQQKNKEGNVGFLRCLLVKPYSLSVLSRMGQDH